MQRFSVFALSTVLFFFLLAPGLLTAADKGVFTITKAEGDVLHVVDGQAPKPLKAGDKVTGGRLAVMEEGSAEVTFPDGKSYPVPQNTLLALDPKLPNLENACAAAGGIRDQSALILVPGENQELPAGKPFKVFVAINPSVVKETALALFSATLEDVQCKNAKRLAEFSTDGKKESKPGKGDFTIHQFKVPQAPAKEGDYKLFIKTVAGTDSKKVGKDQTVVVVKP